MLRRFFLACLISFLLATSALAERRVALILAAEEYRHLRPLSNPVNDARAMEDLLKGLGFEVWTETDRDLRRMRRALEDFREDGAGADLALVFYAGHGVAIEGVNYLLPVDAEAQSASGLAQSSLPLSEVQEVLAAITPNAIFLLDACRDDPFAGSGTAGPDGRGAVALSDDDADDKGRAPQAVPGLGRIGRADGALFAFAAAPGETASDGDGRNSPFTDALLRHFGTKGVELRLALTLVQQDVYDRSRGVQLPYIESGLPRLLYLSEPGELPERDVLLMAMAELAPELRAEVEEMARISDMPLAPLYRAVLSGDLAKVGRDERRMKLEEAARAFTAFEADMRKFASDDPRVSDLRGRAEEQFALGSSDAGRALMAEAAAIDASAGAALRENLVARSLSEASTHVLNANAARASLRYDLAISDLSRATELYNRIAGEMPEREAKAAYSLALSDLTALFQTVGNSSGALSTSLSLVDYLDALTKAEPPDIGWKRELLWALKISGEIMTQQGFLNDANAYYQRAGDVAATLIALRPEDDDIQRERAVVLNSRGVILFLLGDYQGALVLHQEAQDISTRLYEADPGVLTWQRDVAYTYEKLGDTWAALAQYDKARDAHDLALKITVDVAARYPDQIAYQLDMAVSFERLGDMLFLEGELDSALAVFQEALKIREAQMERDPSDVRHRRGIAITWSRIGDVQNLMGDQGSALMSWQYSQTLRQELVDLDPQNAVWLRDLSISWEKIGQLYEREGAYDEAITAQYEALRLRQAVVDIDPSSLPPYRDLSITIETLSGIYLALGDESAARDLLETSLEIRRRLVTEAPLVTDYRADIAYTLTSLAEAEYRAGDAAAALPHLDEARELREEIVREVPGDSAVWRNLSVGLNLQVNVLLALGDKEQAVKLGRRSVEAMDRMAGLAPGDKLLLSDRFFTAGRLAEALEAAGDLAGALAAFREAAGFAFELSAKDPWSVVAAQDYAYALENTGRIAMLQEDYPSAQRDFDAAIALRKWVTGQQPASVGDQRSLGYALRSLADSYYFAKDYETGRAAEEEALPIMRWIVEVEPENVLNVVDLASGLYRASYYYQDGSIYLSEAVALLEGLEESGRMPEGPYREWLRLYRERLEQLRAGKGEGPGP